MEGWVWDLLEFQWEQGFSYLKAYVAQEGHARVPSKYKTEDGHNLGNWINTQRGNKDRLTPERITRLESLEGWVWDVLEYQWEQGFSCLKEFIEQECHALVPDKFKTEDGYKLGQWVNTQRSNKDRLTPERITRLESLEGWIWSASNNGKGSINKERR